MTASFFERVNFNEVTPQIRKQLPASALLSKNVRIHTRRTSVRLEPEMWRALNEIATAEGCSIHDLCGAVHDLKEPAASFTAALRVFLMEYYRSAAKASPQVNNIRQHLKKYMPVMAAGAGKI